MCANTLDFRAYQSMLLYSCEWSKDIIKIHMYIFRQANYKIVDKKLKIDVNKLSVLNFNFFYEQ